MAKQPQPNAGPARKPIERSHHPDLRKGSLPRFPQSLEFILTTGEVAKILFVSLQTVIRLCESGTLKSINLPGFSHRRILAPDLLAFMEQENLHRLIPDSLRNLKPPQFVVDSDYWKLVEKAWQKELLTTGEVALILGVAPKTASALIDSKYLRGFRIPGSKDRRVPRAELIKFMRAHGYEGFIPVIGTPRGIAWVGANPSTPVMQGARAFIETSPEFGSALKLSIRSGEELCRLFLTEKLRSGVLVVNRDSPAGRSVAGVLKSSVELRSAFSVVWIEGGFRRDPEGRRNRKSPQDAAALVASIGELFESNKTEEGTDQPSAT